MPAGQRLPQDAALISDEKLLSEGALEIVGRIAPASNATFLADLSVDGRSERCVYKPVAGERELWDFPDGTLAAREVAAYVVSVGLGWDLVPPTVLREGPHGPGMVQLWREPDPGQAPVTIVREGRVPAGYRVALEGFDDDKRRVALVHEDSEVMQRIAVFDVVTNNADRKGGHVLGMADGHRYAVDHGVCFHEDHKLRTVLWGWAGQPLIEEHLDAVVAAAGSVSLVAALERLLSAAEVEAFVRRCGRLATVGVLPDQSESWPAVPWPVF